MAVIQYTFTHKQYIEQHNEQQNNTINNSNWEECGPCPVFASYTLAFALQLRKKHGKTSVKTAEECQLVRWKKNIQNRTCSLTTRLAIQAKNLAHSHYFEQEHTSCVGSKITGVQCVYVCAYKELQSLHVFTEQCVQTGVIPSLLHEQSAQ